MKLNEVTKKYTIWVDMDGVIADFSTGAAKIMGIKPSEFPSANRPKDREFDNRLWSAVRGHEKAGKVFWGELPKMPDMDKLWSYVEKYDPQILTAAGDKQTAARKEKKEWIEKHIGSHVKVNIVTHSPEKAEFADETAVLIDDRKKSIDPWVKAGGIGILHTSAEDTIKQLKKLGL